MYVRMYVCMYACMYVCIFVSLLIDGRSMSGLYFNKTYLYSVEKNVLFMHTQQQIAIL